MVCMCVCADVDECETSNICHQTCINSHRSFRCGCKSGYDLLPNRFSCTKRCPKGCVNGSCHRISKGSGSSLSHHFQYECRCRAGWSGVACNIPVCLGGCSHGRCVSPNTCLCEKGWEGVSCSAPVCPGGCVNGICIRPEKCLCEKGYNGSQCHAPICLKTQCYHGVCTAPETCTCKPGWQDVECNLPVCKEACQNGGRCILPNTCECDNSKWTGQYCETPICQQQCLNGGTCTAPGVCSCPDAFAGNLCQIAMCTDLPAVLGSKWSCIVSNNSRSCSLTCSDGYDFVYPANANNLYSCDSNGRWDETVVNQRSRELPVCGKVEPVALISIVSLEFEYQGVCENLTQSNRNQLEETTTRQVMNALCSRVDCMHTDITTKLQQCKSAPSDAFLSKRSVMQTRGLDITFTIRVNVSHISTLTHCTPECQQNISQMYTTMRENVVTLIRVLEDPSVSLSQLSYSPRSAHISDAELYCPANWYVAVGTSCIICPPGSYKHRKCHRCAKDTYQDHANQTSCKPCPPGTGTLRKSSFLLSHCVDQCIINPSGPGCDSHVRNNNGNHQISTTVKSTTQPTTNNLLPYLCYPPNHGILSEPWRKVSVETDRNNIRDDNTKKGGNFRNGWYRFSDDIGGKMPESCPPTDRCGTTVTGWLNGTHPSTLGEMVARKVCFHFFENCCAEQTATVKVINCGSYYVYHLPDSLWFPGGYCGDA